MSHLLSAASSPSTAENTTQLVTEDGKQFSLYTKLTALSPSPSPNPPPNPPPQPPNPVGNIGPDGVLQLYPTKAGGLELYMMDNPDKNKINVSFGTGSHLPYNKMTEGQLTFFRIDSVKLNYGSGGSGKTTRIDNYPGGGIWGNKTNYSWQSNPGWLFKDTIFCDEEFTTYIRTSGSINAHEAYAHKMAGRDEDAIRSVFEFVFPTASHSTVTANFNFAHFPYVSAKPNILINPPKLVDGQWVGAKTVRIVAADKKSAHWEFWISLNPFDNTGKPTNDWKLAATFEDHGTSAYGNKPTSWGCQKAVCRVDGHTQVDMALFSWRAIDGTKPNPHTQLHAYAASITPLLYVQDREEQYQILDFDPNLTEEELAEAQKIKAQKGLQ